MMGTKLFSETILKFWKIVVKMAEQLLRDTYFRYFCNNWCDTDLLILVLLISGTKLENNID